MNVLSGMKITAHRELVLGTLKKNRESHHAIVVEARAGYAKRAREVLLQELAKLEASENRVVVFTLRAPSDHTKVYDTAIAMMEMHTEPTVVLDSDQVRTLMMDEWHWKRSFLHANRAYSYTARSLHDEPEDE